MIRPHCVRLLLCCCVTFLLCQGGVSAEPRLVPRDEALDRLREYSSKWELWINTSGIVTSGTVRIKQTEATNKVNLNEEDDQKKTTASSDPSSVVGNFARVEVARVEFHSDSILGSHWSHWTNIEPIRFIDLDNDQTEIHSIQGREYFSLVTESDFFHRFVDARIGSIAGGPLPDELVKIDLEQQRSTAGSFRSIIFRDEPIAAKSFKERSYVFDATHFYKIGGKLIGDYLGLVARDVELGKNVQMWDEQDMQGRLSRVKLRVPFKSSPTAEPSLLVDSFWTHPIDRPQSEIVLDDVKMSFVNAGLTNESFQTSYKWDTSQLEEGRITPTESHFSVSNSDREVFDRITEVQEWQRPEVHPPGTFEVVSLEVKTGDIIYDREAQLVSYVANDKTPIDLGRIAANSNTTTIKTKKQSLTRTLVIINVLVCLALASFFLIRRRYINDRGN